jgi:hypothetical protein
MRRRHLFSGIVSAILFTSSAWAQINACDLATPYGTIDASDVQAAINMALGTTPCTANIAGSGVCNVSVVQRVVNAVSGSCVTGYGAIPHAATLTWSASTSSNVAGYNIYRSTTSGGPYTKINSSLVNGTTYTDLSTLAGVTYYYVVTAVDGSSNESSYSNQTQGSVPTP